MNLQPVKTAEVARLRDPKTGKLLPNISDVTADPFMADLDDPHWYRAAQVGDLIVVKSSSAAAASAPLLSVTTNQTAPAADTSASAAATTASVAGSISSKN